MNMKQIKYLGTMRLLSGSKIKKKKAGKPLLAFFFDGWTYFKIPCSSSI